MMYYSIGEVSGTTGIAISTLRYYDKEGLFPTKIIFPTCSYFLYHF